MNLLLLLTALLASLTGTGSGVRGLRGPQDVAVVRAAEVVEAVAQRAQIAIPMLPAQAHIAARQGWTVADSPALPSAEQRFERRLE